jgi:PAS domain-containing protein
MPQREIELILFRQLANALALPIWIADVDGRLIFYNESAEPLLGLRFDEAGEIALEELSRLFEVHDLDGEPLDPRELPLSVALFDHRPMHRRLQIRALDGLWRTVDITAFPIEGQGGRRLGAAAIFWEAAVE